MSHFYLSPHPDDVALSCGAHLAALTERGEQVTIVTMLSSDPPQEFMDLPLTPLAEENWSRWGLGSGAAATAGRRVEDSNAAQVLNAKIVFGPYVEALYRMAEGRALYPDLASLFGIPHPADPLWGMVVRERAGDVIHWLGLSARDTLHIPLGVGNHVDHQLVRHWGQEIAIQADNLDLRYYEEYPYSIRKRNAVENALQQSGIATQAKPVTYLLSQTALDTKIRSVGCYRSQLSDFALTFDQIAADIRAYSTQVGGEREWVAHPLSVEHSADS